jgi:hypothetical protein
MGRKGKIPGVSYLFPESTTTRTLAVDASPVVINQINLPGLPQLNRVIRRTCGCSNTVLSSEPETQTMMIALAPGPNAISPPFSQALHRTAR